MREAMLKPLRADRRGLAPRGPLYSRTYYQFLPVAPLTTDLEPARQYYARVCHLIDRGGWTRGEWAGLHRLERRWRARVDGDDRRWSVVGARPGRLPKALEDALRPAPAEGWTRPLAPGETGE